MKITLETPVSMCVGSDSYAGKIIEIDGKCISVHSPTLGLRYFTRRKNGHYYLRGKKMGEHPYLHFGKSETKLDPEF